MGQGKGLLSPIEILESEYESETESSTGSALSAQRSQATPPPLTSPSLSLSPPLLYTISQSNYPAIIWQLQEQIAALTAQVGGGGVGGNAVAATEVAKLQTFDEIPSKVSRFLSTCKLCIRLRLREVSVKEQIQ